MHKELEAFAIFFPLRGKLLVFLKKTGLDSNACYEKRALLFGIESESLHNEQGECSGTQALGRCTEHLQMSLSIHSVWISSAASVCMCVCVEEFAACVITEIASHSASSAALFSRGPTELHF